MAGSALVADACEQCLLMLLDIPPWIIALSFGTTIVGAIALLYLLLFVLAPVPREPFPEETTYETISDHGTITKPQPLPCWQNKLKAQAGRPVTVDKAELFMSVVVPAYNEQYRLSGMLEEAVNYLEHAYGTLATHMGKDEQLKQNSRHTTRNRKAASKANGKPVDASSQQLRGWEILIVSDGSTDKTIDTAFSFAKDHQLSLHPRGHPGPWTKQSTEGVRIPPGTIRVVTLKKNRGKGGAVTHGMKYVRGQYVVFADADGASKFDDLGKLVQACQQVEDSQGRGVAVGSRAHLVGSEAVVKRSKLRNFLMHSFHITIRLLTPPATASIKDTQCGFKLFSRPSLPFIVPYMHSEGWIFDVEMLMLAEFAGIPVAEVPVGWREVKGSKLNVVWDSIGMAWGLAMLRAAWGLGVYRRKVTLS